MKKLITLTEKDLHNVIRDSVSKVLTEAYGIFNGCEEKAVEITKKLREKWNCDDINQCPEFYVGFDFCPTGYLWIFPADLRLRGAYVLDKDATDGDDVILINPKILHGEDNLIIKTLVHELTHAYEDFQRMKKGSSLYDYANNTNYRNARDLRIKNNSENKLRDKISRIMIYLSTFEVNASLAALNSLIFHPKEGRRFGTVDELVYYIYSTKECQRLMDYATMAMWCAQTENGREMDEILKILNEISSNKFKTERQARRYLMTLCNRTTRRVKKLIPKLVNAYFEKQKENQ